MLMNLKSSSKLDQLSKTELQQWDFFFYFQNSGTKKRKLLEKQVYQQREGM